MDKQITDEDTEEEKDVFLPVAEKCKPVNQLHDTESPSAIPVDRGWAWVVLIGSVVCMTIVLGAWRTTGIFFNIFQEKFQSSAMMTSIIPSIQNAAFSITGPVIMTVGVHMLSCRQYVIIGGTMASLSYIINALTSHISIVIVSQGIIQGIGYGMVEPCVVSMVTKHFKKRRSLANSLTAASGSIGGFIFPPLVTLLHRYYGYFGCMLILTAINLNVGAIALVFRPESYYKKQKLKIQNHDLLKKSFCKSDSASKISIGKLTIKDSILKYFDYNLFKDPLFVLFQISFALLCGGMYMSIFLNPPIAKEFGLNKTNIALTVTVYAVIDLFFQIVNGIIADTGICRRSTLLGISFLIFGINAHFVRFYTSFELFLVYSITQGAAGASLMPLYPGIIVDYLSLKNLDSSIGFAMLGLGVPSAIFLYIGGIIKDVTGSYVMDFHIAGFLSMVGALIMISLPVVEKSLHRHTESDIELKIGDQNVNSV